MANEKTDYFEAAVIDYFLRPAAAAPTRPTSIKVGLLTAITTAETGTVTETAYAGYARQDAGFGASSQNAGFARTSNAAQLNYPAVAGGPITIVGYAIYDHLGNILDVVTLGASVTYQTGDIPFIPAGGITHDEG